MFKCMDVWMARHVMTETHRDTQRHTETHRHTDTLTEPQTEPQWGPDEKIMESHTSTQNGLGAEDVVIIF